MPQTRRSTAFAFSVLHSRRSYRYVVEPASVEDRALARSKRKAHHMSITQPAVFACIGEGKRLGAKGGGPTQYVSPAPFGSATKPFLLITVPSPSHMYYLRVRSIIPGRNPTTLLRLSLGQRPHHHTAYGQASSKRTANKHGMSCL